jgi:hypothetical protein
VATDLRTWLGDDWTIVRNSTDRQKGQAGCAGEFTVSHPHLLWPFAVECKTVSGVEVRQLWAPTKAWAGHWEQAVRQAESVDLAPMLVSRAPRDPCVVLVRREDVRLLGDVPGPRMDVELCGERLVALSWAGLMATPVPGWPEAVVAGRMR